MEITNMVAYVSLLKDVKSIWGSMSASQKDKFDRTVKKCANTFIPPGELDAQKEYFLNSPDRLPQRIMKMIQDPEVKSYAAKRWGKDPNKPDPSTLPDDFRPILKCRMCGTLHQVEIS